MNTAEKPIEKLRLNPSVASRACCFNETRRVFSISASARSAALISAMPLAGVMTRLSSSGSR